MSRVSIPDEDEPGARRLDLILDAAQLRRLLFAEESTVVAEPDQHHRPALVERMQRDLATIEIEHRALAQSSTHHVASFGHAARR